MRFALEYSVTRTFRWLWFAPAALLGAFIAVIFLTIINEDYNVAQTLWFHRFMPFRHPSGSICDGYQFKVGDSFKTNYTFFDWSIESIIKPNVGKSGLLYRGTTFSTCDVSSIYANGYIQSWNIDFTVIIVCNTDSDFQITARTSFSKSILPGTYQPLFGTVRVDNTGIQDFRGVVLDLIVTWASNDIGNRTYNALIVSNYTTPVIYSVQASFDPCPISLGGTAACALAAPNVSIISASAVYPNATVLLYDQQDPVDLMPWVLDEDVEQPLLNLLQAVHACVRIELGNPSWNNFILNPSFLNSTIHAEFPSTRWNPGQDHSLLYRAWANPVPILKPYLPVTTSGPANIQVVYPCRFQKPKSTGYFFVSVLVATLSMFSTGWALFMLIAGIVAKKADPVGGNRCDWHCSRHRLTVEPSDFELRAVPSPPQGYTYTPVED